MNSIPDTDRMVKEIAKRFITFMADYPDPEKVIRALMVHDEESFEKYFCEFVDTEIQYTGWANGIHCPICGSPMEGTMCACMSRISRSHGIHSEYLLPEEEHSEHYKRRRRAIEEP